ncbi:unnamed protein product [Tilletia controversa]|uniref:Non-structural maintenance of chromosomes element 4 n=2 Tax=Tilletia TaxID=13289 RepID=A0A177VC14_9BASI|nr:hypothetical protein CF336_g3614 [Tilletia laevis]KAE8261785.1 hypothetical protein A4X03_0g2965 [Tilletia caries]CAD6915442.1 unnamed protein product [Tilletia controversa]KAE8204055.1 hypothetical protein CF335_g2788 [Tilletia laevis]CAD6887788.1 unnamed protein product [Tilletia caries]
MAHGTQDSSQAGPSRSQQDPDASQPMDVDGDSKSFSQSQAQATAKNAFQDANEKRELRKKYRGLLAAAEDARKEITDQTSESLTSMLKQTDDLFNKVKAPSEGILDARLLGQMVDIGTHMARTLKTNADAFDTDSFLSRVARVVGGQVRSGARRGADDLDDDEAVLAANEWNWDELGRLAAKHSRRAVSLDFLLGPLQAKPKERKQTERTKKVKEKVGVAVRPEELKDTDIQRSENETTVMVRQIANLLEEVGEVHLFNFVVDPTSFSNTVENLFYVSFLVRDGKVSVDFDDKTNEPMLMRTEPPRDEDFQQGLTKRQLVVEFDMKLYKDIIETYDITESIIPTRKEAKKEATSGRWYG